jgi:serine/threonine protein kinase/Tfp pilus assembly protein PilF
MSKEDNDDKSEYWKIREKVVIFNTFAFERMNSDNKYYSDGEFGNLFPVVERNYDFDMMVKVAKENVLDGNQEYLESSIKKESKILLIIPSHPNIIESFMVVKLFGKYHIFMELVGGGNLAQLIKNDSFKTIGGPELYLFIYQIAEGMKFLHSHDIIHKDLKPENILISNTKNDDGSIILMPKIADFGISSLIKKTEESANLDYFNNIGDDDSTKGYSNKAFTPAYASPEQEGLIFSQEIDKRSDIFSFGIVILELITSQLNFKEKINYYQSVFYSIDETANEKMVAILDNEFQTRIEKFINDHKKYTHIVIKKIIKKCLKIDPDNRYPDFDEIVKELETLIFSVENADIIKSLSKIKNIIKNCHSSFYPILFNELRGLSLNSLGYEEESKHYFKKILEFTCNFGFEYGIKGNALFHLGRYEEAIEAFDKAIGLEPDNYTARHNRAITLTKLGKQKENIKEHGKAISLAPDKDISYYTKGNALFHLGRYEEAIEAFDKAIGLEPDNCLSYFDKGNALFHLGRYEEAIEQYNKAISLSYDVIRALSSFNKSTTLFRLGKHKESIEEYDKITNTNNVYSILHYYFKGNAIFHLGKYNEKYNKTTVLENLPNNFLIFYSRVNALYRLQRFNHGNDEVHKTYVYANESIGMV